MEENRFGININPAPGVSTEDWYLGCIKSLVDELGKFEEVNLYGKERLDMLKDKQTKERIEIAIKYKEDAKARIGKRLTADNSYTYEQYKKELNEINEVYNKWMEDIKADRPATAFIK